MEHLEFTRGKSTRLQGKSKNNRFFREPKVAQKTDSPTSHGTPADWKNQKVKMHVELRGSIPRDEQIASEHDYIASTAMAHYQGQSVMMT
jgi:hypothetical protein